MKILSIDVGTRNLGVCILEYASLDAPGRILHWEVIDLHAKTSSTATRSCVQAFWSRRPMFYDVDVILIESQDRAVSKMRRLSNAIESHFETVRVVLDKTYRIDWSSGDVKLRAYDGPVVWEEPKTKTKYKMNKLLGIEHARALLAQWESIEWIDWFEKLPKQDDVADCLLQAVYYAKNAGRTKKARKRTTAVACIIIDDD